MILNAVKKGGVFAAGAVGYGAIEILWRGHTHWSMLLAGGVVFSFACRINSRYKRGALWLRSLVLSSFITTCELVFGLFFNEALCMDVWDYSSMPFNFRGQICLLYSILWTLLSFGICALYQPVKNAGAAFAARRIKTAKTVLKR